MKYPSVFMSYVVFIFVSVLVVCAVAYSGEWNNIHINDYDLSNSTQYENKKQRYYYIRQWYDVSPDKTLTITFNLNVTYFRCWSYFERTNIDSTLVLSQNMVTIPKVTISGIWQCDISAVDRNLNIFLKIRVIDFNPPQMVFVNRTALSTQKEYLRNHNAIYYYEVGDTLDVACFLPDDRCKVQMKSESELQQILEREKEIWGVCLQYNLQAKNNGMSISFITKCPDFETVLKVTFMQRSKANHYINVKINGQVVKYRSNVINYNYFLNDDFLNITGDINYETNLRITGNCEFCHVLDQRDDINRISFKIKPNEISKLTLYAREVNDKKNEVVEQVVIIFTPIYANDISTLVVNLSQYTVKPLYNIYEFSGSISKSFYIYNYNDEEILKMNCSQPVAFPNTHLIINGTGQENNAKNSYFRYIPLQKKHNNTRLSCILEQNYPYIKTLGEIDILLLLKSTASLINPKASTPSSTILTEDSPNTTPIPVLVSSRTWTATSLKPTKTSNTTGMHDKDVDDGDKIKWIIIGVGIVVFFCLICVFIVIYKMKIRGCHKNQRNDNYDNLENDNNAMIPPYPAQWKSDYAVPEGELYDNSLYGCKEPIYTKPIPKKLRTGKNKLIKKNYYEPCVSYINSKEAMPYASLSLKAQKPGCSKSTYTNQENAVNSQIVPQKPKYENVAGRDYVEPAYCEPSFIK